MSITRTKLHKDKFSFICGSFQFKYSGRVFIYMSHDSKGFYVICEGFKYDFIFHELTFGKDLFFRSAHTSLYKAIGSFHFMCELILKNGMDWFNSDAFDEDVFFRECNRNIFE